MIQKLSLQDFRNYEHREFVFESKNIVFCGPNGIGKTNILESIALLSVGKSWRESSPSDLIRDGASSALLSATLSNNDLYTISVQERSRQFYKNEKKIPLHRYFGGIATLLFVPEYLHLLTGSRSNRVRFFDRFCLQLSSEFRDVMARFNKAIRQKNAVLKDERFMGDSEELRHLLHPWNVILSETIPEIIRYRKDMLESLNPFMSAQMKNISGNNEEVFIHLTHKEVYEPTKEGVASFFEEQHYKEVSARRALIGAHLDDFSFFLRDKPLSSSASRGEERSVLLSLLSAQKTMMQSQYDKEIILLLDDVFSELDQSRQDYLEHLCQESQIFFTTTHTDHFKNFRAPTEMYEIV